MLALVHPFNPSSDVQQTTQHRSKPRVKQSTQLPSSSSLTTTPASSSISTPTSSPLPPTVQPVPAPALDIDSYPPHKLLKLLASLLTQIASTNDALSPATSNIALSTVSPAILDNPLWRSLTSASRSALSTPSATLTFHARNIPTISLEAYLLRILKYCPTTNQVFLSLLVYFDRMAKLTADATARTFVIDSYNIHRLVIAGVTVASKFFSDVFYTNSRYAKVGGLPLTELNQLELQFLLLNDFRLVISSAEMQRYAEQLILFSQSHSEYVSPMSISIPSSPSPDQAPTTPTHTQLPITQSSPPSLVSPRHHSNDNDAVSSSRAQASNMSAMGAIDAYGGRVPGDIPNDYPMTRHSQPSSHRPLYPPNHDSQFANSTSTLTAAQQNNRTPNARPVYSHNERRDSTSSVSTSEDTETETENETTGTETDADAEDTSTTDDEPTIRPGRSSVSGSVYSVASSAASASSGGSSGGGAGNNRQAGDSRRGDREKESDACSVRSFDTGDEGGDEYDEGDEEMDEDRPARSESARSSVERGRQMVIDDGERTPETRADERREVKRLRRGEDRDAVRGVEGDVALQVDWEGDLRMRSPRP
ncbi:hypothetical protein AMATHDRAFT_4079 [Amanita thiersii Skay4041]|uniref:Cyclin-domain-containing protein n=1 Tax=Amanita thiersii Skay4041 TaxID=703135 RepID=A0A2A9NRQ7_9AGAR|nr:hypothetical protein AMATHDRAFT_4079 [Amanita thiersii Skay4041]